MPFPLCFRSLSLFILSSLFAFTGLGPSQETTQADKPQLGKENDVVQTKGLDGSLRWAIIGDTTAISSGLIDLLSVQLDANGYTLLERSQTEELSKELERGLVSASTSMKQTMDAARKLGANRVLFCRHLFASDSQSKDTDPMPLGLKVIVCDVDSLARLASTNFEMEKSPLMSQRIADYLRIVDNDLPSDSKMVIGFPPFGCKNIGTDFIGLGEAAHDLLSSQLLSIPGVVVMEWESVRDLAKEMVSRDELNKRQVPIIIEVDYTAIPKSDENPPRVDIALRIKSNRGSNEASAIIKFSELETWLWSQILPQLLSPERGQPPLAQREQVEALKSRAESLSRLGACLACAQVREVLLQMTPSDVDERLRLLRDYWHLCQPVDILRRVSIYPLDVQRLQARTFGREHLEYLIRNRQISYSEAIDRFQKSIIGFDCNLGVLRTSPKCLLSVLELERSLASLDQDDEYVRSIAPEILRLKEPDQETQDEGLKQRMAWSDAVLTVAFLRVWFHYWNEESRTYAARLISDMIPHDFPTGNLGARIFNVSAYPKSLIKFAGPNAGSRSGQVSQIAVGNSPKDVLQFNSRLSQYQHRHLELYQRMAEFDHRFAKPLQLYNVHWKETDRAENGNLVDFDDLLSQLERILELAKETTAAEKLTGPNQRHFDYIFNAASVCQREVIRRKAGKPPITYPAAPVREPSLGRLRFTKTSIEPPKLDYYSAGWITDGPDHDLVYDKRNVYRLDRQGNFVTIGNTKDRLFFDDRYVWGLEKSDRGIGRLVITDRQGRVIVSDESTAFPPCMDFHAYSVGTGRGIVIGWHDTGTWCGYIHLDDRKLEFKVFHQAREYYQQDVLREVENASSRIGTRFTPRWFAVGRDSMGEILLVGRRDLDPIRIDLKTLDLSIVPMDRNQASSGVLIANEKLYYSQTVSLFECDLATQQTTLQSKQIVGNDIGELIKQGNATAGSNSGMIMRDGDWLYFPGMTWYRYHLVTSQVERLVPTRLPHPYATGLIGKSSIHGLILFHPKDDSVPGSAYQVTVVP